MKTTKKLIILCLVAVMAVVAVMPSTFSWYTHDRNLEDKGNAIGYSRSNLSLSLQQSSGVVMKTYKADEFGKKENSEVSSFNSTSEVNAKETQRYITTLTNNGEKDVSVDLDLSKITNNAKVYVGVYDPVINEKSYASRATLEKVDWDYEVIYFEPREHYSWWDGKGTNRYIAPLDSNNNPTAYNNATNITYNSSLTNDLNLLYSVGSTENMMGMQMCPLGDTVDNKTFDVYRAFVTTAADDLFFFNHYYVTEDTNKERNRTPSVSDFHEGRTYYLNGKTNKYNNKDLSYHDAFTATNICVYYYYKTATMAIGKTADIGLKQGTAKDVDEGNEFDYLGKNISYSVPLESNCTVSRDGLITANSAGETTITTTITGEFGDTLTLDTKVNVPEKIDQVPIVHNVKIPAGKSVDVSWYVKNDSASGAGFDNIFCNV